MSVNATTMRSRLDAHGISVPEGQPKALLAAYGDLVKSLGGKYSAPVKSTPTPAKAAAPVKAKPAPANCGCGCGQPTITAKATFLAGHDARHAGNLARAIVAGEDVTEPYGRLSERLQAKVDSLVEAWAKQAKVKAAKEAAKAAYEAALAEATK